MPCTKCGSQDHSRDNCRWPGVLLFVTFSILAVFHAIFKIASNQLGVRLGGLFRR